LWFGLNCEEDERSCYDLIPYKGPSKGGPKEHRYIFLLLRQVRPPPSGSLLTDHILGRADRKFDLAAFLRDGEGSMEPRAMNLFYVDFGPKVAAIEPPKATGARSLGSAWKDRPAAEHDEL